MLFNPFKLYRLLSIWRILLRCFFYSAARFAATVSCFILYHVRSNRINRLPPAISFIYPAVGASLFLSHFLCTFSSPPPNYNRVTYTGREAKKSFLLPAGGRFISHRLQYICISSTIGHNHQYITSSRAMRSAAPED